jgi:hypothetical protein
VRTVAAVEAGHVRWTRRESALSDVVFAAIGSAVPVDVLDEEICPTDR